jgi:hypothetical protein
MNVKESKAPEYIEFPYDVFLMLRLEFLALCHDELEAKIMRIIEKAISEEWERIYRERCASTPKNQEVKMPDEVWAAIPIRYFMDRLLGTVQSETTLKDALKSLINTKKFVMRKDRSGKYEAPLYTLNREPITKFFETLPSDPRKLDILSLMKQPRKKKAVSGDQLLTPSNNDPIKTDGYNSRYHQLLTPSTPIIDPMTELAGDQLLTPTNMYYLDDNLDDKDTYTDVPSEIGTPSPLSLLLQSFREGNEKEQKEILQVLIDAGIVPSQNENHSHNPSPELLETSLQAGNSTSLPEVSILPAQQAENAPCKIKTDNSTPTLENGLEVAKPQASDVHLIALVSEQKMIDVPLGPPAMPLDNAKWNAETLVDIVEAKIGSRFSEKLRGARSQRYRQLEAAKKIIAVQVTREEFVSAYDDRNDNWWRSNKGKLTVEDMAANTPRRVMRVLEVMESVEAKAGKLLQFPSSVPVVAGSQAERNREIYTGYDFTDLESQFYPTDAQKRAHAAQG